MQSSFISDAPLTGRAVIREFVKSTGRPACAGALRYSTKTNTLKFHGVPIAAHVGDDIIVITMRRKQGNTVRDRINQLLQAVGCRTRILYGGHSFNDGRPLKDTDSWAVVGKRLVPTADALTESGQCPNCTDAYCDHHCTEGA